jgi:predicted SAM-dependent methyltransferase
VFNGKGVDMVWDLNILPYPFKDNSVDEIYFRNIIEHLSLTTSVIMKEFERILKTNGKVTIITDHFSSSYAFYHSHIKYGFCWTNFIDDTNFINDYVSESGFLLDFKVIKNKITFEKNKVLWYNYFMEWLVNKWKFPYHYERTGWHSLFPAHRLETELIKR